MLAVSDDVTEWKQAQEALRFSEERFRTLVHSLDVGVVLYGIDGKMQFANPAALRMFNMKLEEVAGSQLGSLGLELIREDGTQLSNRMHPVPQVLETGRPIRDRVVGWRVPGTEEFRWVIGNVVPLLAEDGKLAGVVGSFSDITEQKKAGEALRQLSGRLLQLQDEERRRLGRDLHDSLAQSVLAVNLSLAQITQSSPSLDERNRSALAKARALLQDMSRQIRTISYLLHPPLLDELGLVSAVKEYASGFSERSGIQVQVGVSPGFGRLSQEAETALFRIIQESLANIQRHSGSPSARIRLEGTPECITLEVSDQGHGMSAASGKKLNKPGALMGVGIAGMRERMSQLGGTLEIESGKSGTIVRATLPVKSEVLDVASRSRSG
jgi:PAS domain S-box-containing protein